MVDPDERSAASRAPDLGQPSLRDIPEQSAATAVPPLPERSAATRPRQVAGDYPMRQVTYYQISTSDMRSIGIAQAAATIFAALGTFALSNYLEFSKDLALAEQKAQEAPAFLYNVADLTFWAWVIFWIAALLAFIWQGSELARIKREHGELSYWQMIKAWWGSRGTR